MAKTNVDMDQLAELRETAARIKDAVETLKATGLKRSLLLHAISKESRVGIRAIERVLDALDDLPALLFEQVTDGE